MGLFGTAVVVVAESGFGLSGLPNFLQRSGTDASLCGFRRAEAISVGKDRRLFRLIAHRFEPFGWK
jgi:hypothetical protein